MNLVWLNGRILSEDAACVSVTDRGFLLGDGVFETMRAYCGRVFRLAAHLQRMTEGAERVGIPMPAGLSNAVTEVLAANGLVGDAAVRITLTRGAAPPGLAPTVPVTPTALVAARPYKPNASWYTEGFRVILASGRRNEHSATQGVKQLGYLDGVMAQAEARAAGADEAIFCDTAGHLVEGTTSNLFLVRDGVIHAPPLWCGILAGITRATVIELTHALGMDLREAHLWPEDLDSADEAFLTGSLREMVPIIAVGNSPLGSGRPGPVFQQLLAAYRDRVRSELGIGPDQKEPIPPAQG